MTREKEGAAIHQDHRSKRKQAISLQPRPSVAEKEADCRSALSLMKLVACVLIGATILFLLMWLAAAY